MGRKPRAFRVDDDVEAMIQRKVEYGDFTTIANDALRAHLGESRAVPAGTAVSPPAGGRQSTRGQPGDGQIKEITQLSSESEPGAGVSVLNAEAREALVLKGKGVARRRAQVNTPNPNDSSGMAALRSGRGLKGLTSRRRP